MQQLSKLDIFNAFINDFVDKVAIKREIKDSTAFSKES